MHISEGILNAPVLISGAVLAAGGVAIGLRRIQQENLVEAALLASAFFVVSLIHAPVLGTSAHLILNGLIGLILGWAAFPVILVGLIMQAFLFQFGGLTTLGINTLTMAAPAVVVYYMFGGLAQSDHPVHAMLAGGAAGVLGIGGSGLLVASALILGGENNSFHYVAALILAAHLPIMAAEGLITAFAVGFLRQVKPQLLGRHYVQVG